MLALVFNQPIPASVGAAPGEAGFSTPGVGVIGKALVGGTAGVSNFSTPAGSAIGKVLVGLNASTANFSTPVGSALGKAKQGAFPNIASFSTPTGVATGKSLQGLSSGTASFTSSSGALGKAVVGVSASSASFTTPGVTASGRTQVVALADPGIASFSTPIGSAKGSSLTGAKAIDVIFTYSDFIPPNSAGGAVYYVRVQQSVSAKVGAQPAECHFDLGSIRASGSSKLSITPQIIKSDVQPGKVKGSARFTVLTKASKFEGRRFGVTGKSLIDLHSLEIKSTTLNCTTLGSSKIEIQFVEANLLADKVFAEGTIGPSEEELLATLFFLNAA